MSPATRDWDAATYDRVAAPVVGLGREVLDRLALRGDETVLDAGCGAGGVTAALVERLPHGRVIAVDASPAMVEQARARLRRGDDALVADLAELELGEPVDAVLSTATFHWVPDHDRLFARLRAALRDGGRLEAQCGGERNIAALRAVIAEVAAEPPFAAGLAGWDGPWTFAGAQETEGRLRAAGFSAVRCWTEERPVVPDEPLAFLETVVLGHHLERLPSALRRPFAERVLARAGQPLALGYERLNITAVAGNGR